MPVTARLSKLFYERMGEQIATELADWFNSVDATYRADLRELNELNFSRFDANVGLRFAEQDARWEKKFAEFEVRIEKRMAEFEIKIEKRMAEFEARIEKRITELELRFERRFTELEVRMANRFDQQTRWMVAMWVTTMLAFAGLYLRH